MSSGTGRASSQPRMSSRLRPTRVASEPAARLVSAFAAPKATMKDSTAAVEPSPKSSSPTSGSVERSSPTIAPTKALSATSSPNCAAFSRRPSCTGRGVKSSSARGRRDRAGAVGGDDRRLVGRRQRDVLEERRDELVLTEREEGVAAPLEADARDRVRRQAATADRAQVMRGVEQDVVGQREQLVVERAVERTRELLCRSRVSGVQ